MRRLFSILKIVLNAVHHSFEKSMKRFSKELGDSGELVAAEGLAGPNEARVVRAGKGGEPEVTDGPFAEAKEFLAGYWIVDVESTERAYAIAARASAAIPDIAPCSEAVASRLLATSSLSSVTVREISATSRATSSASERS